MNDYADWTGWGYVRSEPMSERLITQYRATLDGYLAEAEVPVGLHWCLVPDAVAPDKLGRDCHPKTGGELAFHAPFAPDDLVTRETVIEDVAFKEGRSGKLGFVTQRHVYKVSGEARVSERQDIVYREDPKPGEARAPERAEDWPGATAWQITPNPVLLFRFSALTFNGHRIHYDHPYATGIEGYEGLVVHGPMQAVWMMNLATHLMGHLPARFSYRGLSPLICNVPVAIEARESDEGLRLRVRRETDGVATMAATAYR